MNTRQALNMSKAREPDTLSITIATQRQQLRDQIDIADRLRKSLNGEPDPDEWERWRLAVNRAVELQKCLSENLEMQNSMTSLSDLKMFQAGTLIEHALKTFERDGDPTYAPALKKAYAKLVKGEGKKSGGARVGG